MFASFVRPLHVTSATHCCDSEYDGCATSWERRNLPHADPTKSTNHFHPNKNANLTTKFTRSNANTIAKSLLPRRTRSNHLPEAVKPRTNSARNCRRLAPSRAPIISHSIMQQAVFAVLCWVSRACAYFGSKQSLDYCFGPVTSFPSGHHPTPHSTCLSMHFKFQPHPYIHFHLTFPHTYNSTFREMGVGLVFV